VYAGPIPAPVHVPHAVPFVFVERLLEFDPPRARLLRRFTRNDALLQGYPVLPPSLVVEAMAQAAGVLITCMDERWTSGVLVGIDAFVMRGPVKVGDALILEVEMRRSHRAFHVVSGRALVAGAVRAEGRLTLSGETPDTEITGRGAAGVTGSDRDPGGPSSGGGRTG
jgi:3-hydroxyacyl-[acyl-carrier-protein] dehydratase